MIEAVSSTQAPAVAYSGGVAPSPGPGFGATLSAKLAEFQTISPSSAILHHHHQHGAGKPVNQDAGNQLTGTGSLMAG